MDRKEFIVGTRKSKLALVQTYYVIDLLKSLFPEFNFSTKQHETVGDKILNVSLPKIGDKGLFTRELEQDLMDAKIDFAVHSLKDLPTDLPIGLTLGAITERIDPSDVLIVRKDLFQMGIKNLNDLAQLPKTAKIGTSSLRRQAQLKYAYPNLEFIDIRGNVDTRLKKLDDLNNDYSAIVLAKAGLERQGDTYLKRITQIIPFQIMHYAVGQGALGIECRANDKLLLKVLTRIHSHKTALMCKSERILLKTLKGGCHVPIGVFGYLENEELYLKARVLPADGSKIVEDSINGPENEFESLGYNLAQKLISKGADKIIQDLRKF